MVLWVFEDPSDPDYIYAEAQGGTHRPRDRHTLEKPLYPAAAIVFGEETAL